MLLGQCCRTWCHIKIQRPDVSLYLKWLCRGLYAFSPVEHGPAPCWTLLPLLGMRLLVASGVHGWMFWCGLWPAPLEAGRGLDPLFVSRLWQVRDSSRLPGTLNSSQLAPGWPASGRVDCPLPLRLSPFGCGHPIWGLNPSPAGMGVRLSPRCVATGLRYSWGLQIAQLSISGSISVPYFPTLRFLWVLGAHTVPHIM